MKGKRILITGGAGLIGSHIAELAAAEQPAGIVVLDNFVRGRMQNLEAALAAFPVRVVEGDIRDTALLGELMQGTDIVFHQAAIRITQCAQEPRLAFDVLADPATHESGAVRAALVRALARASGLGGMVGEDRRAGKGQNRDVGHGHC